MKTKIAILTMGMLVWAICPTHAQKTFFSTGFEYDPVPIVVSPADLNGATDQVGEWSGDDFPLGQGDILVFGTDIDAVGIVPSPYGGSLMLLDRPTGDPDRPNSEPNSDFTGSYFADLVNPVGLVGTEISFQVGTRRTGGNHEKSYDIVGRDSSGAESFRLRVGANNNGEERLGVVTDNGNSVVFNLPTLVGDDGPADLDNTGGFNVDDGPGLNAEIANVSLRLGKSGYTVDFSYPLENTSQFANAYTTDLLVYNGAGVDLAQIEFTYEASGSDGRNSGYLLDNILVQGFEGLVLGDFNFDSAVDQADFTVMLSNFHSGSDFDQGDINFDGQINLYDFFEFKQLFQGQAGAVAVPEPRGLALFGIASLWLASLRTAHRTGLPHDVLRQTKCEVSFRE